MNPSLHRAGASKTLVSPQCRICIPFCSIPQSCLFADLNKKKKHGISFSCKASKSLTRRWSRSKAPVPSHPISLHPSIAVCAWDHSPVPGGREKTEEFTTQEHMGTRNVRSQEKQPCDYACNHGTGLILKQDVRKNAKEFVFFPNPVKLP